MKALAIDCAVSKIAIACKNGDNSVKLVYDLGIRQSEKLLPAIDFVLKELSLLPSQLDYCSLTVGPGSFTGLRLGLSTLKAINLACGTPVYGIGSLEAYAYQYSSGRESVISVIEAKEDEYFFQFFHGGKPLTKVDYGDTKGIVGRLSHEGVTLVAGPGTESFLEGACGMDPLLSLEGFGSGGDCTCGLFALAEKMVAAGEKPLEDYDGPIYARKSEAELVLEAKNSASK
ncbi:MAG: tRNA (adenosine(37)-N6)-threonylcarbamoyltransferase complex dimerization subunit type 1 TsaB [Treponema sp.]|nr:tRNA (adenosine(37)-N6)-threonylcarbamoyltransferase complex dimerization subunit type 1 TsaB [Treponema sp.]MCR5622395.1 tRNA (adenosine(37)-N6)-threonylcarbamoyltransferase complex dimerization subunit type 1 TsaB [Treponema sp.]